MASFPTSKYARYKRATSFFLDWLLRARGLCRRAGGKRVQLDEFNEVVRQIAADPSILTPKLLQELPKALVACQCAITYREHVAAYFAEDNEAQVGHRHFLKLLKGWGQTLEALAVEQHDAAAEEVKRFENYYEVLEVDEDYFPDEDTFVRGKEAPKRAEADRKRLFDQAFDEDLRLEVASFFLELEELVEEVFNVYDQVKKQKRTMMEAAVVVNVAMDMADALTAGLQLRYPALQTAEDLLFVLMDSPSSGLRDQIAKASRDVRDKFEKDGTYTFVPGMLLNDFSTVWWTLASFRSTVAGQEDKKDLYWNLLVLPEEDHGERYGEERTPQHLLPDSDNVIMFLLHQLPMLYNAIRGSNKKKKSKNKHKRAGTDFKREELVHSFVALFEEYFETRKVTVPLVFFCICWTKSVAALQGDAGMSRNISLTIQHSKRLVENMEAALEKGEMLGHDLIEDCADTIKESTSSHALSRMNPVLAGYMMTAHHMKYLLLASGILLSTPRLRAFGLLYLALTEQGFLERIPFFDELLEIYEDKIFIPSRASAVHGSYNRAWLLSGHHTTAAVDAIYRGVPLPNNKTYTKDRTKFPEDTTDTFRLVIEKDMSCLGSAPPRTMLQKAADICSKELFDTRTLSRDLMALNDDLVEVFSEMCDALERRQFHNEYTGDREREGSCSTNTMRAPVTAVMFPLLPLLDCLQRDGSMNWSKLPVGLFTHHECHVDGERVRTMCKKVAAVITAKFAKAARVFENRYFLFPPKPDFVDREYGTVSFKQKTSNESHKSVFSELMNLLKSSYGPLSNTDLNRLKSEIKKDPELLGMTSHSIKTDPADKVSQPVDDLCTLLHQAAAGPAHDIDLVDWMIQMGAFTNQPLHCREQSTLSDVECAHEALPNTMAVHSAVIAGHADIARMMLEAANLEDLNTPTFHSKDTLAHLAVKHGHRKLLFLLRCFGANVYTKNGCGEQVGDLVAGMGWADEIAEIFASMPGLQKNRDAVVDHEAFTRQVSSRADRLRELVFAQRDVKQQRAVQNLPTRFEVSKKQKRPAKKRRKAAGCAAAETNKVDLHSSRQTDLAVRRALADGSPFEMALTKLSQAFARLRNPSIRGADKAGDVETACIAIKKLKGLTQLLSRTDALKTSELLLRHAVSFEAYRVIHMAQKFYRVDHVAVRGPALAPLRNLCCTTLEFTKFVLSTAQLCVSISRTSQARELLDLLEKRLLKTPYADREPSEFRGMVQRYSTVRDTLGFGQASSLGTMHCFEWYLTTWTDNDALVLKLDRMVGSQFYFRLQTDVDDHKFDKFEAALSTVSELDGVGCLGKSGKCVVYGGRNQDEVMRTRELVLGVSRDVGIQLIDANPQPWTPAINIGEFEFSAAGVSRKAAAAAW